MTPTRTSNPDPVFAGPTNGRRRRGFTFVELMLGMAITAMVSAALAAFSFAVAQSWKTGESQQYLQMSSNQAIRYLQSELRDTRCLGYCNVGGLTDADATAAIVYWKTDNGDNKIQLGELALIEYDPGDPDVADDGRLLLYDPIDASQRTPQEIIDAVRNVTTAEINLSSAVTNLKAWTLFRSPKAFATRLTGAEFAARAGSATARPGLEFTLTFTRDGDSIMRFGTAALRNPFTASN